MTNKFDDILNTCLERLSRGEDPEHILLAYPEHAARLRPLLATAGVLCSAMKRAPAPESPNRGLPQFRRAAILAQSGGRKPGFIFLGVWRRSWALAAGVAMVLIVAIGTTGVAAAGSMPDQALYRVKIAAEEIQFAVTPSRLGKAKLEARLAGKRIEELEYVLDRDDPRLAEQVSRRLYTHYHKIENLLRDNGSMPPAEDTAVPAAPATPATPATPASPTARVKPTPRPKPKVTNVRPTSAQLARELAELRRMLRENDPKQEAVMRKVELQEQQKAVRAARAEMRRALEKSLREYRQAITAAGEDPGSP